MYDAQIDKVQAHNTVLEKELKKLSQTAVNLQVDAMKGEEVKENGPLKHSKTLQMTHKNLFKELESVRTELADLRKQQRVFGLHKRCAVEQTRRLN